MFITNLDSIFISVFLSVLCAAGIVLLNRMLRSKKTEKSPDTDPEIQRKKQMEEEKKQKIPAGYRENSIGHLVPEANISDIDKLRDDFVRELVLKAEAIGDQVQAFKSSAMAEVSKFVELAALEHGVAVGGDKGNLTLTSFDGKYRVIRAIDDDIGFNEGMTTARELILHCIEKWSSGSDPHLTTLVSRAFEVNDNGHLSTSRIMSLNSYKIDDDEWRTAMEMITKSIIVLAKVHYIRFYSRGSDGKWQQIALDPSFRS